MDRFCRNWRIWRRGWKRSRKKLAPFAKCKLRLKKRWALFKVSFLLCFSIFEDWINFRWLSHCLFNSDLFIIWLNYWFFKLFDFLILDPAGSSVSQAEKEEVDARSIYVGNVSFVYLWFYLWLIQNLCYVVTLFYIWSMLCDSAQVERLGVCFCLYMIFVTLSFCNLFGGFRVFWHIFVAYSLNFRLRI